MTLNLSKGMGREMESSDSNFMPKAGDLGFWESREPPPPPPTPERRESPDAYMGIARGLLAARRLPIEKGIGSTR